MTVKICPKCKAGWDVKDSPYCPRGCNIDKEKYKPKKRK